MKPLNRLVLLLLACSTMLIFSDCKKDDDNPEPQIRIRKDAKDLTQQEKADFVEAVLALKSTPSPYSDSLSYYDQFVKFHQMAVEKKLCTDLGVAHANPAFPPWHRKLLILFEDALREVSGKDVRLPYWDWTNQASTDAVFSDDLLGGDGDPNEEFAVMSGPFRKGNFTVNLFTIRPDYIGLNPHPWLVRNFAATVDEDTLSYPGYPVSLPQSSDIQHCLDMETYDMAPWDCSGSGNTSFRFCLEGFLDGTCGGAQAMHNIGHDWVAGFFKIPVDTFKMVPVESVNPFCGNIMRDTVPNNIRVGSMEPLDVSPNDPAFFLHHCNVDRIWAEWQLLPDNADKYQPVAGEADGYNLLDEMYPYNIPGYRGLGSMDDYGLTPNSMLNTEVLGYKYE
ncbi:MAG: tyrosinase family protein [Bacteroidetes bacterium]|nr:tyrosinase family protein [Bacteroidota bacterium]